VDGVVADETRKYYAFVERIADTYFDADFQHYAIVIGNANYSLPLTRFLASEIGWLPELSVITDSLSDEQKNTIRSSLADFKTVKIPDPVFETNASEIQPHFTKSRNIFTDDRYAHKYSPLFVFGSYVDRELAENLGAKKLSVSFPLVERAVLDRGYAGFKGGLNLLEDILNTLLFVR
jgi:nitrogenase molybdenum-iron protein beta chain